MLSGEAELAVAGLDLVPDGLAARDGRLASGILALGATALNDVK